MVSNGVRVRREGALMLGRRGSAGPTEERKHAKRGALLRKSYGGPAECRVVRKKNALSDNFGWFRLGSGPPTLSLWRAGPPSSEPAAQKATEGSYRGQKTATSNGNKPP